MKCHICKSEMEYVGKNGVSQKYYCRRCHESIYITPTKYDSGITSFDYQYYSSTK
jgi:hypothetical protein